MARFGTLGTQYFDKSGLPLVRGLLRFYEPGTTTSKVTYADINQTIENEDIIELTADGRQPNVFFTGSARAVLTTSLGVLIDDKDPVGETSANIPFEEWNPIFSYAVNNLALSAGKLWISIANDNVGNTPSSSPTFWKLLPDSILGYQTLIPAKNLFVGATGGGVIAHAPGAEGNVLVSRVASPTGFANESVVNNSAEILLSVTSFSTQSNVDVEEFTSPYDDYIIELVNVSLSAAHDIHTRWKTAGSYVTTLYDWLVVDSSATLQTSQASIPTGMTAANRCINLRYRIRGVNSTTLPKSCVTSELAGYTTSVLSVPQVGVVGSNTTITTAVTGVRFYCPSGATLTGERRVYGVRKAL